MKTNLEAMTSLEFNKAVRESGTVIIPISSIEQTGRHCPVGTDFLVAQAVAKQIAEKSNSVVAPTIPYGDALELDFWPGTIDVGSKALSIYIEAVARGFLRHGMRNIVFLCTHSLNIKCVDMLCRTLHREGFGACAIDWWKAVSLAAAGDTLSEQPTGHGGEIITSVALALFPDLVRLEDATDEASLPHLDYISRHMPGAPFIDYGDFRDYCDSGAWGRVRGIANAEKGKKWITKAVELSANFINESLEKTKSNRLRS
jgi:creatinine amidohydrolase